MLCELASDDWVVCSPCGVLVELSPEPSLLSWEEDEEESFSTALCLLVFGGSSPDPSEESLDSSLDVLLASSALRIW